MERNTKYPHLNTYRDVTPAIDEAIKTLDFMFDYQKTYFAVQRELKTALFRLTNERFLERIKQENNETLLREVEKIAPLKDVIIKLSDDIDIFEAESKKLLNAIIASGKMDGKEFDVIYPYFYNLAMDNTSHDHIPTELVFFFGEDTREKCSTLPDEEYAVLCYLLIKIKSKCRYFFAYPHLADELVLLADASKDMPYRARENFYLEAADYYDRARQRDKAMTCYKKAATIAKDNGDTQDSAQAMRKYYRMNQLFPKAMQVKVDEDEIKKEYGKYAHIVLEGIREKCLKVDPVEFTEGFAEKLQEVMWKVEAAIDKEGDFHSGYQRWQLMEQYFGEMKIRWRNPKQMNPDMMFD